MDKNQIIKTIVFGTLIVIIIVGAVAIRQHYVTMVKEIECNKVMECDTVKCDTTKCDQP